MWKAIKRFFRPRQHDKGWCCPACGMTRQSQGGPDPCLGYLPGIKFACCGHGEENGGAYFYFTNGKIIRIYGDVSVETKQ